ncbi:MAG TPA: bifunctional sulfate adenylyltransferase/adenylylsulfate kinase [Thermodesulfovibrionia bacterium]|nr:bifunctional sulfate adenylyltransferase/adenylylsulfate kinase [Thermodesulfovibrionia bacterium]
MSRLIAPHGGKVCNLLISPAQPDVIEELKEESIHFYSLTLTEKQLFDLELLVNGAFSPLTGFMTSNAYNSVLENLHLPDNVFWPVPVTLDISDNVVDAVKPGDSIALRDREGFMLAVLKVEDIWKVDKEKEALSLFGTDDPKHPGVDFLFNHTQSNYVGGSVTGIQLPIHYDFKMLRLTPSELRANFIRMGWRRVVAYQTCKPLHEIHKRMTLEAANEARANILIQGVVGTVHPKEMNYYTRVRCYQKISEKFPPNIMMLNLLPLSLKMADQREPLLQAIIQKNYGCSHFLFEQQELFEDGDPSCSLRINESQKDLFDKHKDELGIEIVPFKEMVYVEEQADYVFINNVPQDKRYFKFTDAELKRRLSEGLDIPKWFTPPEIVEELRRAWPPKDKQGFTVFFTGLSGAGKSTIANILVVKFMEMGTRPVTLLDGDIVRLNLSRELGFSKEHRDINIKRIGFVASEITKNGGIAICAPIAPYLEPRKVNRELISKYGGYIEVYVATPVDVCEGRDRKGLYKKARAGLVLGFTGVNDPYEIPENPEIIIDTTEMSPDECAQEVMLYLERQGYIK